MIVNRNNLKTLFTAYSAAFHGAFTAAVPDYQKITMTVPSTTSENEYGFLGQTTAFREWLGDRTIQNVKAHGFSIKNKSFENTVGVPRDKIEDDQFGVYTPLMAQLGQDAANHPGILVWNLLKNGFNTVCYDGQYFFDTDHPVLDASGAEQSVSNFGGGSGAAWYLLDTTRVLKPLILQQRKAYNFIALDQETDENVAMRKEFIYGVDARLNVGFGLWQLAYASKQDLTADNFNAAYAALQGTKGDMGNPLGIRPSLLVVPPSLRAQALTVVKAETAANGATNINRDVVDVLSSPWLS